MPTGGSTGEPWKSVRRVVRVRSSQNTGVFADRVRFMRSKDHMLLSFSQVFDVDEEGKALLEQVAAQVYMPIEAARQFLKNFGEALKDEAEQ